MMASLTVAALPRALARPSVEPRLAARPGVPTREPVLGMRDLGLGRRRDGFVYAPETYDPEKPAPLLVMLHGAGGSSKTAWAPYAEMAKPRGIVVLAIDSRSRGTWDRIEGSWGDDVAFLDQALADVFSRYRIDPARLALGGFSDGASYALTLGAANGDLFSHLVAFAPGSISGVEIRGKPRIFISHGTRDNILPIRLSRDQLAPALREAGYEVTYRETNARHEVTWDISTEMLDWFMGPRT